MATHPIRPQGLSAALNPVFAEVRASTPQTETRFNRPGFWFSVTSAIQSPARRKLLLGMVLMTGVVPGLLLFGAYQGIRGRLARQVRPELLDPDMNQNRRFLRSGVGKTEWRAVSRLARSGDDSHARPVRDAVIRSNALKLIRLRPEAATVKQTLDQCSTGQLCQLARLVVKEPGVEETIDGKSVRTLPVSGAIFQRLRELQVDRLRESPILDARSIQALQAAKADSVADRISFEGHPAVAEGAPPDQGARQKMLRALAAELIAPASLGDALQDGRLLSACERHADALELLQQSPDQAREAGLPEQLIDALLDLGHAPFEGDRSVRETVLASAVKQTIDGFDFKPFADRLQAISSDLGVPASFKGFLKDVFGAYFAGQMGQDRATLLASLWRGSLGTDDQDRQLVELLKGSGPFMQKIMQMVCESIEDPATRETLSEVKNRLNPIDPFTKKALLAQIVRESEGRITAVSGVRTLGAASVGEALLGKVQVPGQNEPREVVIKLLRPGVAERAERERSMIVDIARRHEGMLLTFTGIADQIADEMDLSREETHIGLAQVYSGQAEGLSVVQAAGLVNKHSQYLLMERAPGRSLGDVISLLERVGRGDAGEAPIDGIDPQGDPGGDGAAGLTRAQQRARRALEIGIGLEQRMAELEKVWLTEALMGSGFFHGDLHAGNIMYSVGEGQMTLIDMGNARVASPEERRALARMLFAIDQGHPRLYQEAIQTLLAPESRMSAESALYDPDLQSAMRIMFAGAGDDLPKVFNRLIDLYMSQGVEIPAFVSNFGRSMVMLRDTLERLRESNEQNFLRSQPGFEATERRYIGLKTEIDRGEAELNALTRSTRQSAAAELQQRGIDPASADHKTLVDDRVREATAALREQLQTFERGLTDLKTELFGGLPRVDDTEVIVRELSRRKWSGLRLLGPGFLTRARFDAVGTVEQERALIGEERIADLERFGNVMRGAGNPFRA